jgi:hypothetical protein
LAAEYCFSGFGFIFPIALANGGSFSITSEFLVGFLHGGWEHAIGILCKEVFKNDYVGGG